MAHYARAFYKAQLQNALKRTLTIAAVCLSVEGGRAVFRFIADYPVKVGHRKRRRSVEKRNPISDALFCDDLTYVPRLYIGGTLHLPARVVRLTS